MIPSLGVAQRVIERKRGRSGAQSVCVGRAVSFEVCG